MRPERITLTPADEASTGPRGTVRQLSFLGDHAVVYVTMNGTDQELTAFVAARDTAELHEGIEVVVGVDPLPVLVV